MVVLMSNDGHARSEHHERTLHPCVHLEADADREAVLEEIGRADGVRAVTIVRNEGPETLLGKLGAFFR